MAAIRTSGNLFAAIAKQWDQHVTDSSVALDPGENVEKQFRSQWVDPAETESQALHWGEARPSPPGPYCVVESLAPAIEAHMSGLAALTERQFQLSIVQFTIHAKDTVSESGYDIAEKLAKVVADAFDPKNLLSMEDDCHVNTTREVDFPVREDDQEWAWVLRFTFRIDAVYDTA